jgi:serine/threonine protein kinase
MLNIGEILQNRYQVVDTVKSGGMGAVYKVFDQRLRTHFALKEAFVYSAAERRQFEHEAQMLAQLDHPVLPHVVDHFAERGGQFLVMEFIAGDDLETLMGRRSQPFDVPTLLAWADRLLDALEYLHSQNPPVIHRDIKPANLKLTGTGRIKLLDFGIAKAGTQTVNAAKAYSLEYSPIEQFSAATHTDARSDIYSLGATLYHLLTNSPPVAAPDRMGGQPLPGPQAFNPDCPPRLAQIILRAMALKPEHRFQSAFEFRAALQQVLPQPTQRVVAPGRGRTRHVFVPAAIVAIAAFGTALYIARPASTVAPASPPATVIATVIASQPTAPPAPSATPVPTAIPTAVPSATPEPPSLTPTLPPTETPTTAPTETPIPTPTEIPTTTPTGVICLVENLGGHLYRQPSRAEGMALGLIWPGDVVVRYEYLKNPAGQWYHVRVIALASKRGAGGVDVGAEGWARATLISEPIGTATP